MTVREYLKTMGENEDVTFIIARAVKDENTPFYHAEYRTTPIRMVREWIGYDDAPILDAIVLNDKQPSITWLSGVDWNIDIKYRHLKSLLIIPPKDMSLMYSKEQADSLEAYIETKLF